MFVLQAKLSGLIISDSSHNSSWDNTKTTVSCIQINKK